MSTPNREPAGTATVSTPTDREIRIVPILVGLGARLLAPFRKESSKSLRGILSDILRCMSLACSDDIELLSCLSE